MDPKNAVVKTPLEHQLQKINFNNLEQYKNVQLFYHLLKILNQIVTTNPQIATSNIFNSLYNYLLNFEEANIIKMLPLFQKFTYVLWNNQDFNLQLRQKTSYYKIVSNWIVNFELRSGKLTTIESQFDLILSFMAKETTTSLERLVMINQIYEDLKELISAEFWIDQKIIIPQNQFSIHKFKKQQQSSLKNIQQTQPQCPEESLNTILKIFEVLESIMNPVYCRMHAKYKIYKNCTYGELSFSNVKQFIKKSIYYILNQGGIPSHLQTELTKVALIYLQSLQIKESHQILNLLKLLMLRTSKAVRFALVIEYVQFYEYLQALGYEQVIEQLENIIYFRQLIIGRKIVEESIAEMGNKMNDLNLSYHELYIKAGTCKTIYFSNEKEDCVLKLQVILEENDINMKIIYFDNIQIPNKQSHQNQLIFDTVAKINEFDGRLKPEKIYWKQQKGTSKKLQLKLQYQGLYCLEFDNTYSWVIPKNVKYRIQFYQLLQ